MFEDEIDNERNVEALVISWYYYAVLILLLHFSLLSETLGNLISVSPDSSNRYSMETPS